tara:strand:+ start:1210 stop:1638 length:429 start_codon:yes stop_codon:yes gene_type:complete
MQEQVLSALDLSKILNINRNVVYYQVKNGSLPKPSMRLKTKDRGPHTYVWKRSELEGVPYFDRLTNTPSINHKDLVMSKAAEIREEMGLPEIKEIVTDNELLRDAIEMRLDKLEENMKLIEKVVDLMNDRKAEKKEKKWWQI